MGDTNIHPGGERRLLLGFDAGCMTCSGLAKKIEEAVGDKLEIRSLNEPAMEHWRRGVLGQDAPWVPTLVEVAGGTVKAWTGPRMGVVLAKRLGLVSTWRVMQILGGLGSDVGGSPHRVPDTVAVDKRSLTRGRFIKGAVGAVSAVSILSGTSMFASAASAWERRASNSKNYEDVVGEELDRIARSVAGRVDVVNVMGSSWSRIMRTGRLVKVVHKGEDVDTLTDATPSLRADNGGIKVGGDGAVVKAARHHLEGGNELLAVAFMADNQLVAYYQFDAPVDGIKSKAEVWEIDQENDTVTLKNASRNGVVDAPSLSPENVSSREGRIYCGGCSSSRRRRKVRVCNRVSYVCLALNCGACVLGAPGYLKLLCVYVYCPYLLYCGAGTCCKSGGCAYACAGCPR